MKNIKLGFLLFFTLILFSGCGSDSNKAQEWIESNYTITSTMQLEYAELFKVDYLNDGYGFVTINNEDYYLVVPEDASIPKTPEGITVLQQPLSDIYVVGSGSMDYFLEADCLDNVKFCSLAADEWELEEVAQSVSDGSIKFAGKYSAPDFELLLNNDCDLVLENTMITHAPEVLIQLKNLGFSTMIDHSSYEKSVQGRMEWIKLYGYLCGNFDTANNVFSEQLKNLELAKKSAEGLTSKKKVAFFSITAANTVSVRKKNDYVVDMIELAGGEYVFDSLEEIEGSGSTTIQMEAFYKLAKDCDVLIYNGTIEGDVSSIDELIAKNELISNIKAVTDGEVYCASGSFYQSAMKLGEVTLDLSKIFNGQDDLAYLVKLK